MTTRLESHAIESFLREYGWTFRSLSADSWFTGWQGQKRSFPLTIERSDSWLSLRMSPLLRLSGTWEEHPEEFFRFLLELNHECELVKLSLDDHGDIILSLQLFGQKISYEDFADALGVVGHYAETLYDSISGHLREQGVHPGLSEEYLT